MLQLITTPKYMVFSSVPLGSGKAYRHRRMRINIQFCISFIPSEKLDLQFLQITLHLQIAVRDAEDFPLLLISRVHCPAESFISGEAFFRNIFSLSPSKWRQQRWKQNHWGIWCSCSLFSALHKATPIK